ncbi:CreA family protein [Pseudodesulfovibrio piezophilus]|uniref:Protein CreA n=1 Tax=Pseudodesulfovibrio piezophilus (strain DSM 21447 / JCM 15486 / C1TLV30) TaxID=1322246 RepID=M1WSJ3_PSEP2|nr:CreA family protein [Pseudodesulfovibrio piezophilus]CCH48912.1 Protein CreA [Pseudodesulfovibrio piezophilus C1TLV30]
MQSLDFFSTKRRSPFGHIFRVFFLALLLCTLSPSPVASEVIGTVDTVFHMFSRDDDIVVEAFDDPDIPGVTCYLSRARKGGVKGMIGLAEDPSDASIECVRTGPIEVPQSVLSGKKDGERVFKKATSLVFKSMQVIRFYDKKRDVLIYMVYSDRVVEGSPKNSVTVVKVQ